MAQSQGHRPVTPVSGAHVLQGAAVRRWIALAEIVADQTRDLVDVLNVFPVPDADTGTNVLLTLRSAFDALHRLGRAADAAQVARAAADGAVRGARGNSGLLISQALAAFADVCAEAPDPTGLRPVELVHVYEAMADTTWAAVSRPVSGTLLSVARDAATAARSALEEATASSPATLSLIASAAAFGAQESVVETSVLGHGPVDAGGAAFMLLLTCLSDTIDAMQDAGRGATEDPELRQGHEDADEHAPYTAVARQMLTDLAAGGVPHSVGPEPLGMSTGEFEVMYLLEATAVQAGQLRRDLERIGDQASDIAGITGYIEDEQLKSGTHIYEMARAASRMVTDSVDSFVRKDLGKARAVQKEDDIVDGLFDTVKNELVGQITEHPDLSGECLDLLMIAKYLERIGDHAVNVAEWVEYSITGAHAGE